MSVLGITTEEYFIIWKGRTWGEYKGGTDIKKAMAKATRILRKSRIKAVYVATKFISSGDYNILCKRECIWKNDHIYVGEWENY